MTQVANIFFNDLIIPYGIPDTVLSDNVQKFVSKYFTSLRSYLGTFKYTATAFHSQTNSHVEKYNQTLVSRLRLHIADNQKNWENFVQLLTYAYDCQVYRSTAKTPFSSVLSGYLPGPTAISHPTALPPDLDNARNPVLLRRRILSQLHAMRTKVSLQLSIQEASYE